MKVLIKTIAILLVFSSTVKAQVADSVVHSEETMIIKPDTNANRVFPTIRLMSTMTKDGLMLRWAPSTKEIWMDGIDYGYILEKLVPGETEGSKATFVPVSSAPLRPWPLEKWKPIVNKDKPYCAAAAQCIYGQEKEKPTGFAAQSDHQDNLFGFNLLAADLDRDAAVASALGYILKGVDTSFIGSYRIRLAASPLSGYKDTVERFVFGRWDIPKPVVMDTIMEKEGSVVLQWLLGSKGSRPTAYYIERSEDNKNYIRLNKQPYINIQTNVMNGSNVVHYVDTVSENYKSYYYRVIGISAFAQEFTPSIPLKAMGRDRTPPNTPVNVTSQETKEGLVMINWDWKDYNNDNDLAGFQVLKSNNNQGPFDTINKVLLPANTKKILDNNPDEVATNFYKILAIDKEGNVSESSLSFAITEDKIAPQSPTNLEAEIDTNGYMLLTWDAPKDKDVRGYLVHFSNGKESNYAVVAGDYLTESYYIDSLSLSTLTESIYYYVVALDLSYNASQASEIIEVKKPDIIAPIPSFFVDYMVSKEGIQVEWTYSKSKDVFQVLLYKREIGGEWKKVLEIDRNKNVYLDSDVTGGVTYEYNIVTIDDANNKSNPEKTLTLEALTPFYIAKVTNLVASKDKLEVSLSWQYDNAVDFEFYIYKSLDDGPMKLFKRQASLTSFKDIEIEKRKSYKYAVVAKSKDGRKSEMVYVSVK